MRPHGFPFPALVGLDTLKMALQLAAIDHRLSLLIRGDKGAGKSTAARGLVDLLADDAPFVTLPIGATEDRLLGGLDVEKALKGEPALKRGLLADASGGVLYVDEVNLLPDHLADALLDAVASGVHVVEREGFSAVQTAESVLVGSMNPEEGALRPQLLDRFALMVDVSAPMDPRIRREVVERRLSYDANPARFAGEWGAEREKLAARLKSARAGLLNVAVPSEIKSAIAESVAAHEVRSLRADLAIVRASRALAALEGASAVTRAHVDAVLPLALAHRARTNPQHPKPPAPNPPRSRDDRRNEEQETNGESTAERVFAPIEVAAPRLSIEHGANRSGSSSASANQPRGTVTHVRPAAEPRELDARATVLHAVRSGRPGRPDVADLHERVRAPEAGTRFIFVVDSSGSHAVQERMRLVKGAVIGLLNAAHGRHDEVVVISCRGASASVLVQPTSDVTDVERALDYLPTGGRTPLAHALELAATYVADASVVVVLTDGHANVASRTDDAWADALAAAGAIRCAALVIDSEDDRRPTGHPKELATALRGTHVRLADLDQTSVLRVLREVS